MDGAMSKKVTQEPTESFPKSPNWNNLSNIISKLVLDYKPEHEKKYSWIHTGINSYINK